MKDQSAETMMNRTILAGMFGVTNMGQPMPDVQSIAQAMCVDPQYRSIDTMVEYFAQQYIESDEHYDIFRAEMESWQSTLSEYTDEDIARIWPNHVTAYNEAKASIKET